MVGQTVSHYRILAELGGGGMGVVYKAEDTKLGRLVALKFISEELSRDAEAIKRFKREARAASSLNHPNICTIYDLDEHEGRQFIVMELMEGRTLKDRLESQPLPTEDIVALAGQITEGLAAAHQRGIIHRDIKPGNLFLTASGLVKVLDFGVAKLLPREEDATLTGTQTVGGAALGTLAYMAPEQLNREPVDARTDIYAVGCVLYEMATGRRPFAMEHGAQLLTSILNRTPEPPSKLNPEVPAWLDAIILKCLEKEPERRYQSAKELQADLQGTPVSLRRVPGGSASSMVRVSLVGVAAVLLLLAVALGLDVGGWRTRLLGGAGPPKIDSLAVLPLENLSGDPEQDYFVEGMHEALTAELSKISALKVISRTSTMRYKDTDKPLPQVARELGVAGVIEGSVLREGNQVRISVQLIHGPSDRHLWAQSFDRELRGILALHSDVARAIANEVQTKLTPQEARRLASTRPVNPEAHEAYLKGLYYSHKTTDPDWKKSFGYFQQAVQKDPNYALAQSGLASGYIMMGNADLLPGPEAYAGAKAAVLKALALDDSLAEAHLSLADLKHYYEWDHAGADKEYRRALELNPNLGDAHAAYSTYLTHVKRYAEAVAAAKRAQELDPVSLGPLTLEGIAHQFAGRHYDRAIELYRKVLELDRNDFLASWFLVQAYIRTGRYEKALAEIRTWREPEVGESLRLGMLAQVHGFSAKRDEALRVRRMLQQKREQEYVKPYILAWSYIALGEKDQALHWLEKAYQEKDDWMNWLLVDPAFDSLRDDPRFQALLRRMNFPE